VRTVCTDRVLVVLAPYKMDSRAWTAGPAMLCAGRLNHKGQHYYDLLVLFVVAGVGADLAISFGVIKLILAPWKRFEKAVDKAGQG
jgi:hypothetical protein